MPTAAPSRAGDLAVIAIAFAIVLLIRITAASDVATGDQPLQIAYVRDVVAHGNWIMQHLADGTPAAKPPLYNWLAALSVEMLGESDFSLKLPSIIAGLLTVAMTWTIARDCVGERGAFIASLLLIASPLFSKHVYFARTDMLLTMLIVAQMMAAARTKPLVFWSAAALALLTKGPVGMLIPILACSFWWWREGDFRERWKAMRWPIGLPLSIAAFGLWFSAAIQTGGRPVFDQLVIAETLDRFRAHSSKSKENRHILYYIPHFFARMAPVSFFAAYEVWRRLSAGARKLRACATFDLVVWWLLTGFVFLSLIPSKRADRLFPLLPAACILAASLINRWRNPRLAAVVLTALMLAGIFAYQHGVIPSNRLEVRETPSAGSSPSPR